MIVKTISVIVSCLLTTSVIAGVLKSPNVSAAVNDNVLKNDLITDQVNPAPALCVRCGSVIL